MNSSRTPAREFYPSTRGFLARVAGFLLIVVAVALFGPGNPSAVALVVSLAVVGTVLLVTWRYWRSRSSAPAIRLFETGIETEGRYLAWEEVRQLDRVDVGGSDMGVNAIQAELEHGEQVIIVIDDLDCPPREVFRLVLEAFQANRRQ